MAKKPRKPKAKKIKTTAFEPYEVGDWIIPINQDQRAPHLYRVMAFSGNFVFAEHFGFSEVASILKKEHTKASDKDVVFVVTWRVKGGKW